MTRVKVGIRGPHAMEHVYDDDFDGEYEFDEFDHLDEIEIDEEDAYPDDPNRALAIQNAEFWASVKWVESFMAPSLFTLLGFAVRVYQLGANPTVVWDEAHFGKFGSYYLRHEFYHDVHPPLGKMLVGLSGYLAGYNGLWDFPSGEQYPPEINYIQMRLFQASFSALCVPAAFFTARELGYGYLPTYFFTLMVALEQSYVTLGRFILLDAMLLFFTVTTVFCLVRFHTQQKQPFSRKWWKWLLFLGVLIGCVNSVKMVGLFATGLVGVYSVIDLLMLLGDKSVSSKVYFLHWIARIFSLIVLPFSIFALCFRIHFALLWHSGTGDANMSSFFQAGLVGSDVVGGPRDVVLGSSKVTIKNHAIGGGGLLHSHIQTYPSGSHQQQVTTYGHKDTNNDWAFQRKRFEKPWEQTSAGPEIEYLYDGEVVRLIHLLTGKNLHTHDVSAPISLSHFEVSGYGTIERGDPYDNWVIEFVDQLSSENVSVLHPLTTTFRLRNEEIGCYLGTSGERLPEWGFSQGEVVCFEKKDIKLRDKRILWNIENHVNENLPTPEGVELPVPSFWRNFVDLNLAMMATNNALVPDPEKHDELALKWWQWPTLNTGIRLCGWGDETVKYYLIGSPATTWTSTVAVIVFPFVVLFYLFRWQRQFQDFVEPRKLEHLLMAGALPMLGWVFHFAPFVIMGRVTYVHHYLPALYFAMLVYTYLFELFASRWYKLPFWKDKAVYFGLYFLNMSLVAGIFWVLRPLSFGMKGSSSEYEYLNLLPTWKVVDV